MNNSPTNTKRMSPYGYLMGMTNCFFMAFYAHGTDTQCYNFGFNDICLWGGCCCQYGPCMYNSYYTFKIPVQALSPANDEFAVKYAAWNPFTCLVYVAIRSSSANDCGIFQIETHEVRRNMGMFCGCSGQPCFCCGNLCTHHSNPPGASDWGTVFSSDGGIGAKGYRSGDPVGKGSYGDVYRATCVETKEERAIKIIDLEYSDDDVEEVRKEISIMSEWQAQQQLHNFYRDLF